MEYIKPTLYLNRAETPLTWGRDVIRLTEELDIEQDRQAEGSLGESGLEFLFLYKDLVRSQAMKRYKREISLYDRA